MLGQIVAVILVYCSLPPIILLILLMALVGRNIGKIFVYCTLPVFVFFLVITVGLKDFVRYNIRSFTSNLLRKLL
jgi:hypothetical protein